MLQNYGKTIKKLRIKEGWTQKELAKKLFKAQSTIGMWEQGRREPDYESLKAISALFKVSVDFIIGNNLSDNNLNLNTTTIDYLQEIDLGEILKDKEVIYQGHKLTEAEINDILNFTRFKLSERNGKKS